jgi:uncharacterized protein (TIGR03437 family)
MIVNLDPAIFDNITAADVYSATGDQIGTATIQGRQVDIEFNSQTGGGGRLPNLPLITINVPVLATATPGAISTPNIQPGSFKWLDAGGQQYTPTFTGSLTIGGSLSIQSVQPIGTPLPTGEIIQVSGTGFTPTTTAQIDGTLLSSTKFVNPQQLTLTLAAPSNLTARRLTVQNPNSPPATFFCSLHGDFSQRPTSGPLANIQPIFPYQLYAAANAGNFVLSQNGIALQNPSATPINVTIQPDNPDGGATPAPTYITLPPGGSYFQSGVTLGGAATFATSLDILPASPIRIAVVGPYQFPGAFATLTGIPLPVTQVGAVINGSVDLPNPLTVNWTIGTPAPAPIVLGITDFTPVPFTAALSNAPWLSVSPQLGTANCIFQGLNPTTCPAASAVTVTFNPTGLVPGAYNATLTLTPQASNPEPTTIPILLNVSTQPFLSADVASVFQAVGSSTKTVHLTSTLDPAQFTVTAATKSGQSWLSVTPIQGQTPATLTINFNTASLTANDSGTITIAGPANSLVIPVNTNLPAVPPPYPPLVAEVQSITFSYQLGQPTPSPQDLNVSPTFGTFTITGVTSTPGNWLSASLVNGPGVGRASVAVDPTGLPVGTYQGSITLAATMASTPATVPVTLVIWTGTPPPVTVTPATLAFTAIHGTAAKSQTVNVATGTLPLTLGAATTTADGAAWLSAVPIGPYPVPLSNDPPVTPDAVSITADATNLSPGTYTGTVTITAPIGSANTTALPVSFTVLASAPPPPPQGTIPLTTAVLNAASQTPGALAPGEILTIFGQNIGPVLPAGLSISNGKVTTTNSMVQVLFDGTPAPLLYVSSTQINTVVPYEVNGAATNISVVYNGTTIPAGSYPLYSSAPAIFTLNGSGEGAAAVLNQDGTVNSASNPAPRGSIIQIFSTGAGATQPAGVTGEITAPTNRAPIEPLVLTIAGVPATVTYAASAPNEVSGLFQVNAMIPQTVSPGSAIPIVLTVGTAQSTATATIAVK